MERLDFKKHTGGMRSLPGEHSPSWLGRQAPADPRPPPSAEYLVNFLQNYVDKVGDGIGSYVTRNKYLDQLVRGWEQGYGGLPGSSAV
jgi:hypothetical protein